MMIWAALYAAVAVFCWGWWFSLGREYARRNPENAAPYVATAVGSGLWSLLWPFVTVMALFYDGRFYWQGWRLPYVERWRRRK